MKVVRSPLLVPPVHKGQGFLNRVEPNSGSSISIAGARQPIKGSIDQGRRSPKVDVKMFTLAQRLTKQEVSNRRDIKLLRAMMDLNNSNM